VTKNSLKNLLLAADVERKSDEEERCGNDARAGGCTAAKRGKAL